MNPRAIHIRLIVWYSGLIILVAVAFAAYTYQGVKQRLYVDMGETLERRAHEIADNILPHISKEQSQDIGSQIEAVYTPEAIDRFIRVIGENDSIFYLSGSPKNGQFDPHAIALNIPSGKSIIPAGQHSLQMFVLPTQVQGKHYLIEMGAPTDQTETALRELIVTLLYGLPVVIAVVSAGGYLLVRRALVPVERIRATAESITFGNLRNRLPISTTGDAIEDLSVTLNQMLDRLESAYEQANRFSADASHELRTPLSIMRTELESLVQKPTMIGTDRETVGIILDETERLSDITEHLFSMSRLDVGEANAHEPVDLAQIGQTTAEQMTPMAQEKDITLNVDTQKTIVSGSEWRLKQIMVNLLDNAIKYTGDGGKISLRVKAQQHNAILEVSDTGIGIPADALPHVFERFYRADKVRSRAQGSAGLGLSIVRSIAQAHGGTVEVESTEGKGTLCRVILPLANGKESKA